jgi:hypothetical protein
LDIVDIAVGEYHSMALKADGTVVDWGSNSDGQSTVPEGLSNITVIAAGANHSLALKVDGTVVAWGLNDHGQIEVPAGLSYVVDMAGGAWHSMALKADGTVVAWGDNYYGQIEMPSGLSNVVAIAAGLLHSLALISASDSVPEQFIFADKADVSLNTEVTSNTIMVQGISATAPISITGGTYSVNGGGYTSSSGTVVSGDTVTVRVQSSGSYSTTTSATLTIGGVSDTFSVTTGSAPQLPPMSPQIPLLEWARRLLRLTVR